MKGLRIANIFGISVELHSTFIILFIFMIAFFALFSFQNLIGYVMLFVFLFVSVLVHELFHSIVSLGLNYKVEKIILLPIGGISFTTEMPEKALHEFLIAIAGPAFNFLIVFAILLLTALVPQIPMPSEQLISTVQGFETALLSFPIFTLLYVNLILGMFNLLVPALPMDGGRVLRSILAFFFGFNKATHMATKVSTLLAIAMFVLGFLSGNILISLIAIFVYLGAKGEDQMVLLKENLKTVKAKSLVKKKYDFFDVNKSLEDAFEEMSKRNVTALICKEFDEFFQVDLNVLKTYNKAYWPVTNCIAAAKKLPRIDSEMPASKALVKMSEAGASILPVFSKTRFIGLLLNDAIQSKYELNKANA